LFAASYDAAIECYQKLLKEAPAAIVYDRLVRAFLGSYQVERAYATADEAARAFPGAAAIWTAQGRAAYRKGKLLEADACFRKALAADPKYPDSIAGLANIYAPPPISNMPSLWLIWRWR